MLQKLTRCILFFGVLLLLLIPVNMVLEPKNNTEEAGMYKASANAIQSQKADSIQVLFLGDSEAYSGFVPLELWNSTGIPSFVCSSLDQKMYETWELLQMAFECQSPKVVVLETNVLYRVYPSTDTIVPTLERYLPVYHDRRNRRKILFRSQQKLYPLCAAVHRWAAVRKHSCVEREYLSGDTSYGSGFL